MQVIHSISSTSDSAIVHSPPPGRGWRLGLTGGMGCGKSTAGDYLAEHCGWQRVDSDALVRELLSEAETITAVVAMFGESILAEDSQSIDRKQLAAVVFAADSALESLEGLLHPQVRRRWEAAIATADTANWVIEVPLLFEKDLAKAFDFTVCVETGPLVQAERLEARGLSTVDMKARLRRQLSIQEKIVRADFVLSNRGSLPFLHRQIDLLHTRLGLSPEA